MILRCLTGDQNINYNVTSVKSMASPCAVTFKFNFWQFVIYKLGFIHFINLIFKILQDLKHTQKFCREMYEFACQVHKLQKENIK